MIENFTEEEIEQLVKELKAMGKYQEVNKGRIMRDIASEIYGERVYICDRISQGIFAIADDVTDNYERKGKNTVRRRGLPKDKEEAYKELISEILEALRPFLGKAVGFRRIKE